MKILLTGASGLVGSAFARAAARNGHEVVGIVGTYPKEIEGLSQQRSLDLTHEPATAAVVRHEHPDAMVNCAAVSMPEACDADPALSQILNVVLPARLARLAREIGARLVHLSSEQVFDGRQRAPYAPTDPTTPINLYGRQKVASERAVHAAAPEHAVTLRAPLLMGNSATGKRSTHERLFLDWMAGRVPKLFTDEFRQPCTAANLAEAMLELCARRELCGVFHWAGAELLSRHALGLRIRGHFKLTEQSAPIGAVTYAEVPGATEKRQACLALGLAPLAEKLETRPQTIAEQLAELQVPELGREWYSALLGGGR